MPAPVVTPTDVLAVFEQQPRPGTPLTAPEVAERVGCARRTAHKKLTTLAEQGALASKKVGARGRVWWLPSGDQPAAETESRAADRPLGERERTLRALHSESRRLMAAETHEEIYTIAVEAAERILGLTLSGVWRYQPHRDVLEPVEWTESGVEAYGEPAAFPVEESLVGQVFQDGTYRAYDDITTEQDVYDPETDVRSELILPLGDHGVLNASSPAVGAFDAVDVSLGRILAAHVETALDRADRLAQRRARRRELKRQRDELATLNEINALVEATIGALVEAATQAEIEATVCDRLAVAEFYEDAWILEPDAAAGVGASGATAAGGADVPADPVATAIADQTPQVIPDVGAAALDTTSTTERGSGPDDHTTATTSDGPPAIAVPLAYADTVFGVLVVHAATVDAFSDREQAAFETLGRVVGFVINATNNRQLLLGTSAVELEVALAGTDAWFPTAADRLDATVKIEGLVPGDEETVVEYVTVTAGSGKPVRRTLETMSPVLDVRVLANEADRCLLECHVRSGATTLAPITDYGATIRTARATADGGTVVVRFPATTAPREALAVVEDALPSASFVAKRVVDVADRSVLTVRQAITDRLTDRQLQVLRAAYLAGYYDAPRGTTAKQLADTLDIAPSTLYQHLQAAQRKLLDIVFDDLTSEGQWRNSSA